MLDLRKKTNKSKILDCYKTIQEKGARKKASSKDMYYSSYKKGSHKGNNPNNS